MKRSSAPNYYDRFKFALTHILDRDVEDGFVCVWRDVEKAMFSAVGKENKVNRLYTFLDKKPSDFHSKPLELLIGDVDNQVDALLGKSVLSHKDTKGRMISPYTHNTYQKQIFQAKLVSEFTTRSQIKIFRNKEVQPPKKQPNINTSGVTEDNKKESKDPKVINYMKEYEKRKNANC